MGVQTLGPRIGKCHKKLRVIFNRGREGSQIGEMVREGLNPRNSKCHKDNVPISIRIGLRVGKYAAKTQNGPLRQAAPEAPGYRKRRRRAAKV